ncbi:hypothetical protein [Butyrivibrio sp.]|uniref:hypothetical protein n=1 Tax=Butyrivibrio sp. TaxID=28121 RepID=UPI0025BB520C|nr:hypothetical protein [Butyrivibrio sp.]MBQ7428419.1 hypothetical protein [Butyrivibrio sp.]MBQ9303351.1 hypothetical protein [Butyrivibrio sp.]
MKSYFISIRQVACITGLTIEQIQDRLASINPVQLEGKLVRTVDLFSEVIECIAPELLFSLAADLPVDKHAVLLKLVNDCLDISRPAVVPDTSDTKPVSINSKNGNTVRNKSRFAVPDKNKEFYHYDVQTNQFRGPDGNMYSSITAMLKACQLTTSTVWKYRKLGWSLEEIYTAFSSGRISRKQKSKNKQPRRSTLTGPLVDADKWGYDTKKKVYRDPQGQEYKSANAMCTAYGYHENTVRSAIRRGITFADFCKTHPVVKETVKASVPSSKAVTPAELRAARACFANESTELPALTYEQLTWVAMMQRMITQIMHATNKSRSQVRKQVYEKMRNTYGIVLSQSLHDFYIAHNIDAHEKSSYFRIVVQEPALASLFEAILTDMSNTMAEIKN